MGSLDGINLSYSVMTDKRQLPKIQELYTDLPEKGKQNDLNVLLNSEPNPKWLMEHPLARGIKYIPIERIEYLLTRVFIRWNVEVKSTQLIGNSVVVCVRLFYQDPLSMDMLWQDGLGASPLQTDKGAGATDFNALKNDAVMKAVPAAESYAVKDAAEKIGKLFGKDLNRGDQIGYDSLLKSFEEKNPVLNSEISFIETLIDNSTYDDERKESLRRYIQTANRVEITSIKKDLENNQLDRVQSGLNYNQTDIKNKLRNDI